MHPVDAALNESAAVRAFPRTEIRSPCNRTESKRAGIGNLAHGHRDQFAGMAAQPRESTVASVSPFRTYASLPSIRSIALRIAPPVPSAGFDR